MHEDSIKNYIDSRWFAKQGPIMDTFSVNSSLGDSSVSLKKLAAAMAVAQAKMFDFDEEIEDPLYVDSDQMMRLPPDYYK